MALGIIESFDCAANGGEQRDPVEDPPPGKDPEPPCFVQPPSLYDNRQFPIPRRGQAPKKDAPGFREGRKPAVDPTPDDPLN